MSVRTVKVSNVSLAASERELKEFFIFSGDIDYLEMKKSEDEQSQTAYVTFKEPQGADTAVLLTGATIVDKTVNITHDPDYQLPPAALEQQTDENTPADSPFQKAEDVVSSMLSKGFMLGKDALNKAKTFDEKHQLTSTATAKVASLGLQEKISMGTAAVNDKVREVDQKFQVSEKTKSALAAAEQKVSDAGSAIMKNRFVFTSTAWAMGAFNKVTKAAGEVGGAKTAEKGEVEEVEEKQKVVRDFAQVHLSEENEEVTTKVDDDAVASDPVKSEEQAEQQPPPQAPTTIKKEESEPEKAAVL